MALSHRLYQTFPFTPFCRACTMRGVQMVGSTQDHGSAGPASSPSRLVPRDTVGGVFGTAPSSGGVSVVPSCRLLTLHPSSWPPLLHARYGASSLLWGL